MGDELGGSISIARNLDKRIPTRSYSQAASLSNTRNHMTEFQPRRMWDESEPNDPLPSPEFPYRPSNANYTPVTPTRRGLGYKRRLEATTSPSASPNNARQTKRRPAEHMTMVNDVVQREHDSEIETDIYSETRSEQGWITDLNHHLTKAVEALDNISIHAKFPDNMCIAAQRIAQAILPPKPVEAPRNNPDDIMPILNQLVKDVQELRQGNKLETSQDSRTQIANGPIITPTPKTKTNSTKITEQENRRRNNPLTRHHPSRLILHIETPPDPTQRQKDRGLVEAINERLKEVTKVTVNGVKWNTKGNCIVITHPDYTADDLLPFKDAFADLIVGNSNYSAAPDKEWFRVLLNSVDTGKSDAEDVMEFEPRTGAEVIYEMKTNNPSVRNINFKTEPSWMAKPETLEHKYHSTMLLTVSSQEEVDYLLKHVSGVFLYGRYASFSRFQDLKPVRQCNRCWSFDHHTSKCLNPPRCRVCAGNHTEPTHTCDSCPSTAKAQKGCNHLPIKCVNCGGAHMADSTKCPVHILTKGSARDPRPSVQGGRRARRPQTTNNSIALTETQSSIPPATSQTHLALAQPITDDMLTGWQ